MFTSLIKKTFQKATENDKNSQSTRPLFISSAGGYDLSERTKSITDILNIEHSQPLGGVILDGFSDKMFPVLSYVSPSNKLWTVVEETTKHFKKQLYDAVFGNCFK